MNDPEFQKQPPVHAEATSVVTIQERNPRQLMVELHRDIHDATLAIVDVGWFSDNAGNAQYWYQKKARGPSADTQAILSAISTLSLAQEVRMTALSDAIDGLKATDAQIDADVQALGQVIPAQAQTIAQLNQTVADLQQQLANAQPPTQQQIDALNQIKSDLDTQHSTLTGLLPTA